MSEQWCGCDGEGMAHKPGADGFLCERNMLLAKIADLEAKVAYFRGKYYEQALDGINPFQITMREYDAVQSRLAKYEKALREIEERTRKMGGTNHAIALEALEDK